MFELLRKLYQIAGKESKKLNKLLIFEILKSIFESLVLGAVMLLLLRIFQNIFEHRPVVRSDVILVFVVAVVSVVGKI